MGECGAGLPVGFPVPEWRALGSAPWCSLGATAMCRCTRAVQNKQTENKPNANLEEQTGDLPVFSVADGIDLKTVELIICVASILRMKTARAVLVGSCLLIRRSYPRRVP